MICIGKDLTEDFHNSFLYFSLFSFPFFFFISFIFVSHERAGQIKQFILQKLFAVPKPLRFYTFQTTLVFLDSLAAILDVEKVAGGEWVPPSLLGLQHYLKYTR